MAALLNTLLEITVYSSILFLVIFTFKKVFHKHISALMNYLVWMLLVVRLLMPVTIDSNIRLIVIPEDTAPVVQTEAGDVTEFSFRTDNESAEYASAQQPLQNTLADVDVGSIESKSSVPAATAIHIDWETVVVLVWVFGIAVYFAGIMFLKRRFRRVLKQSSADVPDDVWAMVDACKKELGINARVRVLMQGSIETPAMTLSLRPTLLLPESMPRVMSREQIALGIRHELTHYKRRDHLMRLLMLMLRGVYWFNPIVWLAYHMMLTDMETACDARVTAHLEKERKDLYIHTIIDLGSDYFARCTMGMGVSGKKNIERRIRGMFMKKKSKRGARAAALLLVPIMLVTCFTTACQPTPEKEVVVNKNNSDLNEKIKQSASPVESDKNLQQTMSIPTQWADSFENQNGQISFKIDATIEIPNVNKVPVVSVTPMAFTQDQVDHMIEVLLDGNELYEPQEMTREQIQSEIVEIQSEITEAKKQPDSNDKSMWLENLLNQLDSAKEQYNKTPEELKKIPATSKIGTIKHHINYTGVKVMADTDVGGMLFRVANGDNGSTVVINQQTSDGASYKEYRYMHEDVETPKGVLITREEAENKAKGIARELDEGLELAYTGVAEAMWQEQVWQMVFIRKVEGFPSTYETHEIGGNESVSMTGPVVSYEKMIISINDKGIAEFGWYTPMKVDKIVNENVKLMPFSDIQSTAKDMIKKSFNDIAEQRKADTAVTHTSVTLDKVTLGLMRIGVKNQPGQYKLIPVWDFYGDSENTLKNSENIPKEKLRSHNVQNNYSLLTINAIDGSIIDRNLGY